MLRLGDEILYTNFYYNPECYYFLYVGDLKNYSMNLFIKETLSREIPGRQVNFIAIVPDVCTQYNYANIMVINPVASADMIENHCFQGSGRPRVSCRIDGEHFMKVVTESATIHSLIDQILANQNHLYINLYESVVSMGLDEIDRVSILGPDKHIAKHFNNKVNQYRELGDVVPLIEGEVVSGRTQLLERTTALRKEWADGVFVSAAFSAAGANSAVTMSQEEVEKKFLIEDGDYLITKYIPHELDPTVLGVVINEEEVYIAGIADQQIEDGNKFVGSIFPSVVSSEQADKLKEYTRAVGRKMGKAGYRGIFGCDYMIDMDGEINFLEINARKQGTTLEFCFTLEQTLPEGAPMLPELEYFAVTENRLAPKAVEMKDNIRQIHWGTYNYKVAEEKVTTGYIPQSSYERDAFKKVAKKELIKDFVLLEHLGTNLRVIPGTFLARVVSVARSHDDVKEGVCQGVGFIQQTVTEN